MRSAFAVGFALLFASLTWAEDTKEAPRLLPPLPHGIGKLIPNLEAKTLSGDKFVLTEALKDKKGVVIALTSTTCPLCKKYLPTFAELEKKYAEKGIAFVYVNPQSAKVDDLKEAAKSVKGAYLPDSESKLCAQLGVTSTTEVLLLDSARTVLYRGAVDDQYGIGFSLDKPNRTFLSDAVDAFLAGKSIEVAATTAPGCVVDIPKAAKPAEVKVTYHNTISRLIRSHCLECHREGGIGPFTLETREEVLSQKATIRRVVNKGTMPPWHAAKGKDEASPFLNDRSLSEAEKKDLLAWLDADGPEGDKADAALPAKFPKEWAIGKPDVVFQIPKPITVKATGTMPYQKVVVETEFEEDKWVQAIEIRPTAKAVVHHVLAFPLPAGKTIPARAEAGGHFAAYVPGNTSQVYPTGYAKKLEKGARLLFQIHYTPNGKAVVDQTEIALIFAKEKPHTEVRVIGLAKPTIEIKPGDSNYENSVSLKLPFDVSILAFAPHMHVRGKACKYEILTDDKKNSTTLLDVPHYDFNWQHAYTYAEPKVLKKGDTIKFTAWYDNSDKNPANPDPKATVRWGPQTTDEMMIGYVEYFIGVPKTPEKK